MKTMALRDISELLKAAFEKQSICVFDGKRSTK